MNKTNIEYIDISDSIDKKSLLTIELSDENLEIDTFFSNILHFLHRHNNLVYVDGVILLDHYHINKFDDILANLRATYLRRKNRDKIKNILEDFIKFFPDELVLSIEK